MPSPRSRLRRSLRPEAGGRHPAAVRLALLVLIPFAAGLASCTGGHPAPPVPPGPRLEPFATEERAYLVDPLTGYSRAVDPERQERLRGAYQALLTASDRDAAIRTAAELLAADPDFSPAEVLAAQVDLGDGDYARVVSRLLPVSDREPQYVASQLLLGRAAELAGDVPLAYSAFREIAIRSQRAFQSAGTLHLRAVEIVGNRLQESLRQGGLEEAERQLSLLRQWAPAETVTLEGARGLAVQRGDRAAELAAVKELSSRQPGDRGLTERRAELELAVGDPGTGLQIIQTLAAQSPNDPALAEKLAAAKFRWRLSLLPRAVQEVAARPELTRADLAVLLYWLVPNVRYGRPSTGRIATDVLDHPHQEEIVRVVNLGLLDVDSTLHRFSPGSPARRGAALRSLVLILSRFGPGLSCLGEAAGKDYPTQAEVCEAAAGCGLIPPGDDCHPAAAVTGGDTVELIRLTLELLGGS